MSPTTQHQQSQSQSLLLAAISSRLPTSLLTTIRILRAVATTSTTATDPPAPDHAISTPPQDKYLEIETTTTTTAPSTDDNTGSHDANSSVGARPDNALGRRLRRSSVTTITTTEQVEETSGGSSLVSCRPGRLWGYNRRIETGRAKETGAGNDNEVFSGVGWQRAASGIEFLKMAHRRAACVPPSHDGPDAERFLYILGVRDVLESLPADLSPSECAQISGSMPNHLRHHSPLPHHHNGSNCTAFPHPPSRLHRLARFLTTSLILLLAVVLPLLAPAVRALDDRLRLWEHLVALGRRVLRALKQGNLRFGDVLGDAAVWGVEGVVGGVTEGLVDALEARGGGGNLELEKRG